MSRAPSHIRNTSHARGTPSPSGRTAPTVDGGAALERGAGRAGTERVAVEDPFAAHRVAEPVTTALAPGRADRHARRIPAGARPTRSPGTAAASRWSTAAAPQPGRSAAPASWPARAAPAAKAVVFRLAPTVKSWPAAGRRRHAVTHREEGGSCGLPRRPRGGGGGHRARAAGRRQQQGRALDERLSTAGGPPALPAAGTGRDRVGGQRGAGDGGQQGHSPGGAAEDALPQWRGAGRQHPLAAQESTQVAVAPRRRGSRDVRRSPARRPAAPERPSGRGGRHPPGVRARPAAGRGSHQARAREQEQVDASAAGPEGEVQAASGSGRRRGLARLARWKVAASRAVAAVAGRPGRSRARSRALQPPASAGASGRRPAAQAQRHRVFAPGPRPAAASRPEAERGQQRAAASRRPGRRARSSRRPPAGRRGPPGR